MRARNCLQPHVLAWGLLLAVLAGIPSLRAEAKPATLDQAEKAFAETLEKARAKLLKEFDLAIQAYTQSGDLTKAEAIRQERSQFLRSLAEDAFPRERKAVKLTPAELEVYTGRYIYGSDGLLEIKRDGEKLKAYIHGTETEATPIGDHRFVSARDGKMARFLIGPDGKATDLVVRDERKLAPRLRKDEWDVVRVRTFIGRRARLILRGNTVQWFHQTGNAPGRLPMAVEPVVVNGVTWHPVLPDAPNWHNHDAYCYSDTFDRVEPALPAEDGPVYVALTEGRGRAFTLQERTEANGYTQIISFESPHGPENRCEVELWFRKPGKTQPRSGSVPAQGRPAVAEGFLAHYPLDGDAKDASGNGHDGQFRGTEPATDRFGKESAACRFSGDSYIEIAPPPQRKAGSPMSVSLWANYDDQPAHDEYSHGLLAQDGRWQGRENRVYHLSSFQGRIVQHFFDWQNDLSATEKVAPGTWYHIATVFDGQAHRLYIDGSIQDGKAGELAASDVQPFCIGTLNSWRRDFHFRGRIDDVRIYGRALTREEVAALYHQDGYGKQPLLLAASRGQTDLVKQILSRGTEVNLQDKFGRTALHHACRGAHVAIVELLLSHEAKVNLKGEGRGGPLHAAVAAGSKEIVELLLGRGADVNAENRHRKTPLHPACALGHLEIAESLLARGANLGATDLAGYTPLHRAAMYDRAEIAKLLLEEGADPLARDREGKTALDRAREMGRAKCAELLERARME